MDPALEHLPSEARAALLSWCEGSARPGFEVCARRTWRRHHFLRLFRRRHQPLTLGRIASKLGGLPYLTDEARWPRVEGRPLHWLGQIDFADLRPHLPPLPERGVLAFWLDRAFWRGRPPLVCRWFPEPDAVRAAALPADAPPCTWLFETALRFCPARLLPDPGDELEQLLGLGLDDGVSRFVGTWGRQYPRASQEVMPAWTSGLAGEPGGLNGRTVLYRLEYENEAGFSLGSNTLYLHIADEDLASGALERTVGAVANW